MIKNIHPLGYEKYKLGYGQKVYFAKISTGMPAHKRLLRREFRTATDAELYGIRFVARYERLIAQVQP